MAVTQQEGGVLLPACEEGERQARKRDASIPWLHQGPVKGMVGSDTRGLCAQDAEERLNRPGGDEACAHHLPAAWIADLAAAAAYFLEIEKRL